MSEWYGEGHREVVKGESLLEGARALDSVVVNARRANEVGKQNVGEQTTDDTIAAHESRKEVTERALRHNAN